MTMRRHVCRLAAARRQLVSSDALPWRPLPRPGAGMPFLVDDGEFARLARICGDAGHPPPSGCRVDVQAGPGTA